MTKVAYRPEIDGLRALAVLAVIVFHLDVVPMPGGFLGVDIFFVISGYLITSLILAEIEAGHFGIGGFYERRIRRILPALYVVLAASLPVALYLLLPAQLSGYGRSVVSTLIFASNFHFMADSGYFAVDAAFKPLLHTWSLAVEEQYYFFFPFVMLALRGKGRRFIMGVLIALGIMSFAANVMLDRTDPNGSFYMLYARGWELMAGALVAILPRSKSAQFKGVGAFGLALMLVALWQGRSQWGLPVGTFAVLGAALFTYAASAEAGVGRFFALRPVVAIGRISYSAYLWHWPLIVYARIWLGRAPNPVEALGIVTATGLLAFLTWKVVEMPLRRRGDRAVLRNAVLIPGLVAVALGIGALAHLAGTGGITFAQSTTRMMDDAILDEKIAINYGLSDLCEGDFKLDAACRTKDQPDILLWGDSYAMHLVQGLLEGLGTDGLAQMTRSTCAPVLGLSVMADDITVAQARGCIAFNDQVMAWLAGEPSVRLVIMASTWGLAATDTYSAETDVRNGADAELVRSAILATAQRIQAMGKQVVIVGPPPMTGENIGQCLVAAARAGRAETACDFATSDVVAWQQWVQDFVRAFADQLPVVMLADIMCPDGRCRTRIGDTFIYRDSGHLSQEGSRYLGRTFGLLDMIRTAANGLSAAK